MVDVIIFISLSLIGGLLIFMLLAIYFITRLNTGETYGNDYDDYNNEEE
jgi:uncharacterized membrane protein